MRLIRLVAALACVLLATTGRAEPLAGTELLRGQFVQERHLKAFAKPVISEGRFVLAPGRGLIWIVQSPFPIVTAVTPAGLLQKAGGAEALRLPASRVPGMSRLYQMLDGALSGNMVDVEGAFVVARDGDHLRLVPRQAGTPGAPFESVTIVLGQFVESVTIDKGNGDFDRIRFSDQRPCSEELDPDESALLQSASQ